MALRAPQERARPACDGADCRQGEWTYKDRDLCVEVVLLDEGYPNPNTVWGVRADAQAASKNLTGWLMPHHVSPPLVVVT